MAELTREQAEAFLETLWPCGHMSHLDNPTRTFFAALMGAKRVPQGIFPHDAARADQRMLAGILRQIAGHLEEGGPSDG